MSTLTINTKKLLTHATTAILAILVAYFVFGVKGLATNMAELDEQRVIKCSLPLSEEQVQNVFYVADDIVKAKKELFNNKKGLYFEGRMYVKTKDFNGKEYIVPFTEVYCDSVGFEVTQEFISKI